MPNALQIADPNADNPLAQAPSYGLAADATGSAVDPLQQWLAAQRAKNQQRSPSLAWNADTGYMGPGTARVEPEKMYDVQPVMDLGNVRLDQPSAAPMSIQERQWADMYDALRRSGASQDVLDYHISQHPQVRIEDRWTQEGGQSAQDANVMMQAMQRRQQQRR